MKSKAFAALFLAAALAVAAASGIRQADAQAGQKVIGNKAEFDAFVAAGKTADPAQRAAALEAFIAHYPASVAKAGALDQAITAYQQKHDAQKVETTAKRLVTLDADNLRALAILTTSEREAAAAGDPNALAAMSDHAKRGLHALSIWKKPDGINAADFNRARGQFDLIFNGAVGFGLLSAKSYGPARDVYVKAIKDDPRDTQNLYQLGVAETQMIPLDANGFWHLAKATALATAQSNTAGAGEIEKYAKAEYRQYHGGDDGWDAIVSAAAVQTSLPAGFAAGIKPGPTPPEIAVQVTRDHDPAMLSIADWEFVLSFRDASPANKDAADKVWTAIQAKQQDGTVPFKFPVTVISAAANAFDAAITDANVAARTADIHVVMAQLLVPQSAPAPGTKVNVVGVISSYSARPFLFTMTHGRL
jgi:hypothetical protein